MDCGLGFLRGSDEVIAESGAVALFMPHGVGHGLGLDVHDCKPLEGDRLILRPMLSICVRVGRVSYIRNGSCAKGRC